MDRNDVDRIKKVIAIALENAGIIRLEQVDGLCEAILTEDDRYEVVIMIKQRI